MGTTHIQCKCIFDVLMDEGRNEGTNEITNKENN
jgi:hypothetical protein